MLVTLNTDASFCQYTGEAGFAFWIACDLGRYKKYGKLKDAKCSLEAEAMCIINGLHFIRTHPELKDVVTKIIVNTDSKQSIEMATRTDVMYRKNKKLRMVRATMQYYLGKRYGKIIYEFRHVPAHKKITDAKSWVNDWLDQHSKIGRKLK